MHSDEVLDVFLSFFRERAHELLPPAQLLPKGDPTLLFVNSGMAPLKPYFTGQLQPPSRELCNVQPCIRTTDIEDVGDRHHLTFFEMLGSWSIGGYFKERAIELAYELLTAGYGLDASRLWVSVFAGDPRLGLPADEQAAAHWEAVGVPRSRIVALGTEDNFWGPAGDCGPCGPCTEVFYDFGPAYGDAHTQLGSAGRYVEIWNAGVFMQFDKTRDGRFEALPFCSVDTGAGLERLTMALNELPSVYDTDLLSPVITSCQEMLAQTSEVLPHHRLLADHVRAATFLLCEGVKPANEGRGYIPRRLIRRCMAVAALRGADNVDLVSVAETAIGVMAARYPELLARKDRILTMLADEEHEFSVALQRGLDHLDALCAAGVEISGADAFRLHATFGLPFEITSEIAAERGISVDAASFHDELRRHREISRDGRRRARGERLAPDDPLSDLPMPDDRQFVGYDTMLCESRVVGIFVGGRATQELDDDEQAQVLLDSSPFYGESGGQVGDSGWLLGEDGIAFEVLATAAHASGYHVHLGHLHSGVLHAGLRITARVDAVRRDAIAANHSATHLLNAALHEVLGDHVRQAGSLVDADRLRFDFTNAGRVSPSQLNEVERIVNRHIFERRRRTIQVLPLDAAKATGAIYLEDQLYGPDVRVVSFDGVSSELCAGTHVVDTSAIGFFKVLGAQSVGAGVRRISAVTRDAALELMLEREAMLVDLAATLGVGPSSLPARIRQLQRLERHRDSGQQLDSLTLQVRHDGIVPLATAVIDEAVDARSAALGRADALGVVVVLASVVKGKTRVTVAVPQALRGKVDARQVVEAVLLPLGGRGGGSSRLAEGGGSPTEHLERLLRALEVPTGAFPDGRA
jgi:alanyl-tRNA synthetase